MFTNTEKRVLNQIAMDYRIIAKQIDSISVFRKGSKKNHKEVVDLMVRMRRIILKDDKVLHRIQANVSERISSQE